MSENLTAPGGATLRVPLAQNLLEFIAVSRSRLSPAEQLEALLLSISLKAPRRVS